MKKKNGSKKNGVKKLYVSGVKKLWLKQIPNIKLSNCIDANEKKYKQVVTQDVLCFGGFINFIFDVVFSN